VLASSLSLLGPIVLCLVVYLRWQLGDSAEERGRASRRAVATRPLTAANACHFEPSSASEAAAPSACASGRALHVSTADLERDRAPDSAPETERSRLPGVYVDAGVAADRGSQDATIRGRLLADRLVAGRFGASQLPRGKKGALDVIVVGANLFGISATARLMQAGLRVLLVDRHSWAPLDASSQRWIAAPAALPRLRLPLVTGHCVSVVAQRADGMLEVQAERAAWYTANVIFASRDAVAVVDESTGRPIAPVGRVVDEPATETSAAAPRAA